MYKNRYFSIRRFANLLKREFHINIKRNLLIIGALYSLLTVIMFLIFQFSQDDLPRDMLETFHLAMFFVILFIGGAFITSFSFIELRDKMKSHFYMLTPGSNFEKFIVNILISLVGYLLFMLMSYLIYSTAFNWMALKVYHIEFGALDIKDERFTSIMQAFILMQSVFFLGAVTFKKFPLILTPIAGFIVISVLSVSNEIIEKIVFANLELKNHYMSRGFGDLFSHYEGIAEVTAFYIIPVILWYVAYLKLNEKEY